MNFWLVVSIALPLAFAIWCFVWHEFGWKRGYGEGFDKGLKDGFEAGKVHADNFWIHAEQDVDQVRQKMRKEGWP